MGWGRRCEFDPELIVPDESLSLENGAIEAWRKNGKRMNIYYSRVLRQFCRDFGVSYTAPYKDIPKKVQQVLMYGTDAKGDHGTGTWFEGVIPNLQRRFENTESEFVKTRLHQYMSEQPCAVCGGTRLKKEALAVRLHTLDEPSTPEAPHEIAHRRRRAAQSRMAEPPNVRRHVARGVHARAERTAKSPNATTVAKKNGKHGRRAACHKEGRRISSQRSALSTARRSPATASTTSPA